MSNHQPKRKKTPWPTKAAMEQIYEKKLWGGDNADFYSGSGSHHPEVVEPYVTKVRSFLSTFDQPPVVCDLGCGDFNVGKELVRYAGTYIAVDIVGDLIERNRSKFKDDHLEFFCRNIAADELPEGDVAVLRNVLQHLSNAEIKQIVPKLTCYRYLIVTEHVPEGDFEPNADIISGQGIRLKKHSGVDLLAPPFDLQASDHEQWLSIPASEGKGVLETTMFEMA